MHALLVAASLLTIQQSPQQPSSQIHGTVVEVRSGAPVTEAVIELRDAQRLATTDSVGDYRFRDVEPGLHQIRVTHLGYEGRELQVFVPDGMDVGLGIELEPRPIALPHLWVTDAARPELPGSSLGGRSAIEVAGRGASASDARLSLLPGGPDYLAALAGGSVVTDPETPSGLHVRGGGADATGVLIDGAPVLTPYHAGGAFGALTPEAISRVDLAGAVPSAAHGGTLSGPVEMHTATAPTDRFTFKGSLSPHAVRTAIAGPVGPVGLVASARRVDPTLLTFAEPRGTGVDATDLFGKLTAPMGGGRFEAFAFWMQDRVGFAPIDPEASPEDVAESPLTPEQLEALRDAEGEGLRNRFAWSGHTVSLAWSREVTRAGPTGREGRGEPGKRRQPLTLRVQGWVSGLTARSRWLDSGGRPLDLGSTRSLTGVRGDVSVGIVRAGLTLQEDESFYLTRDLGPGISGEEGAPEFEMEAGQRSLAAFVEARPTPSPGWDVSLGLRASAAQGRALELEPRIATRVALGRAVDVSAGLARTIQDVQSLRNSEFLSARLFAAEPPLSSGLPGIPAARSDEIALAVQVRPLPGMTARVLGYERWFDGLVLVGPLTSKPFAPRAEDLGIGRGRAHGLEVAASWGSGPWSVGLEYGLASTTRTLEDESYSPDFLSRHSLATRLAFTPTDRLLLHLSVLANAGRWTTPVRGLGEWEPCIQLGGCDITGLPERQGGELNAHRLPAYFRVDAGVRKGWHVRLFGRPARLDGFLRLSNLTNRGNVLGYTSSVASPELRAIPMLPVAAVTAGIDWSF